MSDVPIDFQDVLITLLLALWKYIFLFCMPNGTYEYPKVLLNVDFKCKNGNWILFMRKWLNFHANECIFALLVAVSRKWLCIFW